MTTGGPRAHRQQLAAELRRIRLLAGMSNSEVARQIGLSHSSVSRLEDGQVLPSFDEVDHWSSAVGASEGVRTQLRALTAAAATEIMAFRPWLRAGPAAIQEDVGRLEESSVAVRACEHLIVPGLLQTLEYAKRIMGAFERPRVDLELAVAARIARQALIHDPARNFEFIVTEYGLRWSPIGTPRAVLSAQLSHISELAGLPNVSVGVIRTGVQTKVALEQGFVFYEGAGAEDSAGIIDVVMLETLAELILVTNQADVMDYRSQLAWLREAADFGPAAISGIRRRKR